MDYLSCFIVCILPHKSRRISLGKQLSMLSVSALRRPSIPVVFLHTVACCIVDTGFLRAVRVQDFCDLLILVIGIDHVFTG